MKALVGFTGFVGSNIANKYDFDCVYNSKNIDEAYDTYPDLLVYAGLRAEKFIANNNPEKDMQSIKQAIENIKRINPKLIVLISTIDVYDSPNGKNEDDIIDTEHQEPYGANRYKLEQWVADNFSNYLIVRLPGLFGINLKKNFIYDYIHYIPSLLNETKYNESSSVSRIIKENYCLQDNGFYKCNCDESDKYLLKEEFKKIGFSALNFTDSRGKFQFYNLANLWKDIELALKNNIKILNIATEPITIGELHKYLSGKTFINELNKNVPNYNFKSKYDKLYGGKDGYLYLKDQILLDIKEFVDSNASI